MSKQEDILHVLRDQLSVLDESDLISKPNYTNIEASCCEYLISRGYKVIEQVKYYDVKHVDNLISTFYNLLEYNYPEKCALISNSKKDVALFSKFVNNREEGLNCTNKQALEDCDKIIRGLFKYEDRLGLNQDIGTWIFGTDKCKWITDKVIQIINNELNSQSDVLMRRLTNTFGSEEDELVTNYLEEGENYGC